MKYEKKHTFHENSKKVSQMKSQIMEECQNKNKMPISPDCRKNKLLQERNIVL